MPMRTTQWKWMALGGLACLMLVVIISKWRDNRASASPETPPGTPLPLVGLPEVPTAPPRPSTSAPVPPADLAPPMTAPPDNAPMPRVPGNTLPPLPEPLTVPGLPPAPAPLPGPPPLPQVGPFPEPLPEPKPVPGPSTPLPQNVGPTPEPTTPPVPPRGAQVPRPNVDVERSVYKETPPPQPTPVPQQPTTPPQVQQVPYTTPVPPSATRPVPPATVPQQPTTTAQQQPSEPGEPPLVSVHGGPTQLYRVRHAGESVREIARKTLGTVERSSEILRLNPDLRSDKVFQVGDGVYLPSDACIPVEDLEAVRPLPLMRKDAPVKPRVVLPLTGTYPANLDDKRVITLPRPIREQLGNTMTVLVSPGPDQCLWLTNQAHLDRLAERLEKSPAREADVRVFKRLYFAQTEKLSVSPDGRLTVSERLAQFAGLHQEVVLVGIDDHFELWDVARWRHYTQEKSANSRTADE